MAPLPSTDTSFPYVIVQVLGDKEYQTLDHFGLNDLQLLPDEPVEYNRLYHSLPGRNTKHRTRNNNEGIIKTTPPYSGVGRCFQMGGSY